MDIERPIGASLDRTISNSSTDGEWVEKELDAFIERRHEGRVKEEGRERPEEQAFKESERREDARRREQSRQAWAEYHRAAAERHRTVLASLIEDHEAAAERYAKGV